MIAQAMIAVRVAVLHCDATKEYGGFTRQMFRDLVSATSLGGVGSQHIELFDFEAQASQFPNWDEVEACIITGSVASAYSSDDWILRLVSEIKDLVARARQGRIRLLGVCFGHQILAQALGGEVPRHPLATSISPYPLPRLMSTEIP
jgi:GMP synthase-like glutamine amidotransferase